MTEVTRREFLRKSLKLGAGITVGASLASQLSKPPSAEAQTSQQQTQEPERLLTEEEQQLKEEVEGYNDNILNPEEGTSWEELAEKRQIAFFNLITKEYLETAMDLLENDENVKVREVLPEHLESSGITDPKRLEDLLEEEISNWKGVFTRVSDRETPSGLPELNFGPEDEQGQLLKGAGFRLYTPQSPQLVKNFRDNEIIIEGGFRVRQAVLAKPNSIKPADSS